MKKVLALILMVLTIVSFSGCRTTVDALKYYKENAELARRLENGVTVVLEPDVEDLSTVTKEQLNAAIDILETRLYNIHCDDVLLSIGDGNKIKVVIPENDGAQPDAAELIDLISKRAVLEFRYVYTEPDENDELRYAVAMEGTGEYIAGAKISFGPIDTRGGSQYYVSLTFTNAGREAFKKATENVVNGTYNGEKIENIIAIVLDDELISAPSVSTVIDSTDCIVHGSFNEASARKLADLIDSGRMPFGFKNVEIAEAE